MDDKRELNDILIGGEDVRTKNTKKLILLAIATIVLIIAIAAIALNLSSSDTKEEIVLNTSNIGDTNQGGDAFTSIPVDDENAEFEKIMQEIRSKQQNAPSQPTTPMPSQPNLQPTTSINEDKIQIPDRVPESPVQITSKPKVQPSKPLANSMPKNNNGDIAENGVYLQVGAFSKTPNKDFLDSINKYSYRVQEIMINSKVITRYLIGPYPNRSAAQKDVSSISRDITTPVLLEIN